ncbi:MAG: hypothetical protein V4472_18165 [Pseudomonadota bacterium]
MTELEANTGEQDYYSKRAAQERALAERADDPTARRIHVELASRYTEIVEQSVPA